MSGAEYCAWPFGPMTRSNPPMPTLSSADTPPETSRLCLPVNTMDAVGSMISTPRVCMSIVASASKYDCAPTLTPLTTMLISWPAWVNSTMRRRAAAVQSMFSVPDSIATLAPDDTANHSTGTRSSSARSRAAMMRRHSGSARDPSDRPGSPSRTTRVMPSGCFAVRFVTRPTTRLAALLPGSRSTGTNRCRVEESATGPRSYSVNSPTGKSERVASGGVSNRMSSNGGISPRRRNRMTVLSYALCGAIGSSDGVVARSEKPTERGVVICRTTSCSWPSCPGTLARTTICSRPDPRTARARRRASSRTTSSPSVHGGCT